uniref:Sushi domain-containing protein n=1 Tax=Plectus sambesii TaxID=2011161 RepID=A0A914WT71_9BILA
MFGFEPREIKLRFRFHLLTATPSNAHTIMMSMIVSVSSQNVNNMIVWRTILFVSLCRLFIIVGHTEACQPTFTDEDIETCSVGPIPFGSFSPAPGSTVMDGETVTLTCNPGTRLQGTVNTATCVSGVLSTSPLVCLPCPDDTTWVFDATTNRCFKAFAGIALPAGACNENANCVGVGAPYGLPSVLAYSLNLQALFDAAQIGFNLGIQPAGQIAFNVGIHDPVANFQYQLDDGTPVPFADILAYSRPGQPNDNAGNTLNYMSIFSYPGGIGFDDAFCPFLAGFNLGSICQIQLVK